MIIRRRVPRAACRVFVVFTACGLATPKTGSPSLQESSAPPSSVATDSAGAGFVLPEGGARAAWSAEVGCAYFNRTFEARGNRVWQVVPTRFATISFTAGALMHVVPEGVFDFGFGPVAGFNLSLGGNSFTVDLGLLSSIEAFVANFYRRFPQRLQLSLNLRAGPLVFGVHARAGVDLAAKQLFVMKGELALTFGWLKAK